MRGLWLLGGWPRLLLFALWNGSVCLGLGACDPPLELMVVGAIALVYLCSVGGWAAFVRLSNRQRTLPNPNETTIRVCLVALLAALQVALAVSVLLPLPPSPSHLQLGFVGAGLLASVSLELFFLLCPTGLCCRREGGDEAQLRSPEAEGFLCGRKRRPGKAAAEAPPPSAPPLELSERQRAGEGEEAKCPLCRAAAVERETSCGHGFCQACVVGLVTGGRPCPVCNDRITRIGPIS